MKKVVQIYPLEKYTLRQKPLEKAIIKGPPGFLSPYPCFDKKWNRTSPIFFNLKKKILTWIKANLLKTLLILSKTKNLKWLHLSITNMEQSVESNSFEKFKAIKSLLILLPYFRYFCKKKRFLLKSSKPGHENLVLITSTVQIELSTLNFNFDDKRNNFNFTFFFRFCSNLFFKF